MIVKTQLGSEESARKTRFEPTGTIAATNTQKAIEEVASEAAPTSVDYIVGTASGSLSAELVATSTTSIAVDIATAGQAQFKRAALTGDVTASANANATTIANDAVTFAKMQNIATNSLIGRDTASSGDPENILLNATLEMDGSLNLQRAALTGDVTASAGSNATTIANDAVTFAKIQNITTDRLLGRDTASSGDTEEISVGGGLEFTGSAGIQRSALTGDVAASAGSNTTTIANDAVTDGKLRDSGALSVIGRSVNSSGDPADISASAGGNGVLRESGNTIGFGTAVVAGGGTGVTSNTAYAVLCGGTTSTGAVQSIASVGTVGQALTSNGAGALPTMQSPTAIIPFIIDGGGSAITTGIKGDIGPFSFACTITKATLLADQSGSIVVDVWKDTYANFPPTDADSITASAPPTISADTKSQDTTLTGWTTTIAAGDILRFNVDSASTVTRVTLALQVNKTSA